MYLHLSADCECIDLPPSALPHPLQLSSVTTVTIVTVTKKELRDIMQLVLSSICISL